MTPLRDLLARCEAAAGPSREIEARLWRALFPDTRIMTDPGTLRPPRREPSYALISEIEIDGWSDWPSLCLIIDAKPVTSSLDAAAALVERMLPGCNWIIGRGRTRPDEPLYGAQILREGPIRDEVIGEGEIEASPALALVAAFLKSLIAGEEKGRG